MSYLTEKQLERLTNLSDRGEAFNTLTRKELYALLTEVQAARTVVEVAALSVGKGADGKIGFAPDYKYAKPLWDAIAAYQQGKGVRMSHTPEPDPREAMGVRVEPDVTAPYTLVPSRHTSPMTGGVLDYGIGATLNGKQVVIGELFARAPMQGAREGVQLNTKWIGERIVDTLNCCTGLNPLAYRECVEALQVCLAWILSGKLDEPLGWLEPRNKAQAALTRAQEQR